MLIGRLKTLLVQKGSWPFVGFWLIGIGILIGRVCFDVKTYCLGSMIMFRWVEPGEYEYLLHLPPGYTDFRNPRPLIVFLHGAGETNKGLDALKRCDLWHFAKGHVEAKDFPFIVVSPITPTYGWQPQRVKNVVERIVQDYSVRYRIDPDRIYLTGFSMGGFGTFETACTDSELFAAIVPVAGGGDPAKAERLKDVPTWAFHGDADDVVACEHSVKMIDSMKEAGDREAKLTVLEGKGHGIMHEVYARPEIYRWLLERKRGRSAE